MATSPAPSSGPKLADAAAYGTFADAAVTACDTERGDDDDEGPAGGDHAGDLLTTAEDADLRRGLEQRHLSMLAIAGAIGTGLFLGLGAAVGTAGPLGALLAYATVGLVVCAVQFALGEAAALLPVTGAFVSSIRCSFCPFEDDLLPSYSRLLSFSSFRLWGVLKHALGRSLGKY